MFDYVATYVCWWQRGIGVLSGSGMEMNVSLRQSALVGAFLTLHGRFEILSLSRSFLSPLVPPGATGLTIFLVEGHGQVVVGCDGAIWFWDIKRVGCFLVLDQSQSQLGWRPSNQSSLLPHLSSLVQPHSGAITATSSTPTAGVAAPPATAAALLSATAWRCTFGHPRRDHHRFGLGFLWCEPCWCNSHMPSSWFFFFY